MSPPSYFLINYTRKEFCFFDQELSIFHILDQALVTNKHWKPTDDVRIQSDSSVALLEHLTNTLEYTNLDNDE